MKKYTILAFCLITVFAFEGCKSASRSYKKGNYYQAVIEAVQKLRSKPTNVEAQDILVKAYPLAKAASLRNIDNALSSNRTDKYDVLVREYENLNALADEIYKSPKAQELIPNPQQYHRELSEAKQLAAEQAYGLGIAALNKGTVEQARLALQYFTSANNYISGYRDVNNKINEAIYHATLRVLVRRPVTNPRYQISADFFYDNLITEMNRTNEKRMIRFYDPEMARIEGMKNPHQYIELNFTDFTVGNVKETVRTQNVTRDSVIVGTVVVDGVKHNAYNTVKAELRIFNRTITSGGVLAVTILDASNNKSLQRRSYSGTFVWEDSWATFKGDDRALSDREKLLCRRQAQIPPDPQTMFVEFTKPIYEQVIPNIRSFYNRY